VRVCADQSPVFSDGWGVRFARRYPLVVFLGVLAGCSTDADGDGRAGDLTLTRQDSASVQIVTDPRPMEALTEISALSPQPFLTLGDADGDGPLLFSQIGDLVPLPGGLLAVADGGSRELRLFREGGEHVRSLGGRGEGPGRFATIDDVARAGQDTLIVWDSRNLRVSLFTPEEGFVRSFPLDVSAGFPPPWIEVPADGRIVVASEVPDVSKLIPGGWQARSDSLLVQQFTDSGREVQEIGRFEGISRATGVLDLGEGRVAIQMPELPFGHEPLTGTLGDRLIVAHSRDFALNVYDRGGALAAIWRYPGLVEPLSPEEVARFREVEQGNRVARITGELLDAFGTPPERPAFDRLLQASDDELWVRRYRWDADAEQTWWVISGAGELRGLVRIPAHLRVREVDDTHVYTVTADDFGVHRIEVFTVARVPADS
jgi:hypothetical protein